MTVIANTSFAFESYSWQQGHSYDETVLPTSTAYQTVPQLFYAANGTKTAQTSFAMQDTRNGGFARIVHKGDVLPSADPAVTGSPVWFT
jgi:hypothetical protein